MFSHKCQKRQSVYIQIEGEATIISDCDSLIKQLSTILKSNILEKYVQNVMDLSRVFIKGTYKYRPNTEISVYDLKTFIALLSSLTKEKQNILVMNIGNKLKTIKHVDPSIDIIPF
jgi:hypothetical protein